MSIRCLQIDAFTSRPFAGNPAAVCLLDRQRQARWMQQVATEMNLSETAFVRPLGDGFELRWFTPALEVDLCGHATLAAAHALWQEKVVSQDSAICFHTRSGLLTARANNDLIELDFPATPPTETPSAAGLLEALAAEAVFVGRSRFDWFVELRGAAELRALAPDFAKLKELGTRGVIVTSRSDDAKFDFVSRFFAPGAGIDEDPVTGSAHCTLAPYWRGRLGKDALTAYQASPRGGVVHVRDSGDRVILGGQAVTVWAGHLSGAAGQDTAAS